MHKIVVPNGSADDAEPVYLNDIMARIQHGEQGSKSTGVVILYAVTDELVCTIFRYSRHVDFALGQLNLQVSVVAERLIASARANKALSGCTTHSPIKHWIPEGAQSYPKVGWTSKRVRDF